MCLFSYLLGGPLGRGAVRLDHQPRPVEVLDLDVVFVCQPVPLGGSYTEGVGAQGQEAGQGEKLLGAKRPHRFFREAVGPWCAGPFPSLT